MSSRWKVTPVSPCSGCSPRLDYAKRPTGSDSFAPAASTSIPSPNSAKAKRSSSASALRHWDRPNREFDGVGRILQGLAVLGFLYFFGRILARYLWNV